MSSTNTDVVYVDMDSVYNLVVSEIPYKTHIIDALNDVLEWDPKVGKYIIIDIKKYQLLKLRYGI